MAVPGGVAHGQVATAMSGGGASVKVLWAQRSVSNHLMQSRRGTGT